MNNILLNLIFISIICFRYNNILTNFYSWFRKNIVEINQNCVSMHLIWKLFDVLTRTLIFDEIQLKSFLECIFVHVIFDTNSAKEKKNWNYYLMFHRFHRLSNLNYRKQIQYYIQYRDWKIFNFLYVWCYML